MREFVKEMCGKVALSAFDLYKTQKLRQIRHDIADDFTDAVRQIAGKSRLALLGFCIVPFAAAAALLAVIGAGLVAATVVYSFSPESLPTALIVIGVVFVIIGVFFILAMGLAIFAKTTEAAVRRMVDADKLERRIRGR